MRSGSVIFAKDVEGLSSFYQSVLELQLIESDSTSHLIGSDQLEILIHAIPSDIAEVIKIENPPLLRANTAVKNVYVVNSLESTRPICEANGGGLKPAEETFSYRGSKMLDGWDPEGNVLQFKELDPS